MTDVIAAVIRRNGRYLICRRPSHKRHGDLWEFPGGKLEPGESFLQAAQRELDEELGLQVSAVGETLLSVHDTGSEFVVHFMEVDVQGEPQALEHAELRWSSGRDLFSLALAPTDQKFAEWLNARRTLDCRGEA